MVQMNILELQRKKKQLQNSAHTEAVTGMRQQEASTIHKADKNNKHTVTNWLIPFLTLSISLSVKQDQKNFVERRTEATEFCFIYNIWTHKPWQNTTVVCRWRQMIYSSQPQSVDSQSWRFFSNKWWKVSHMSYIIIIPKRRLRRWRSYSWLLRRQRWPKCGQS